MRIFLDKPVKLLDVMRYLPFWAGSPSHTRARSKPDWVNHYRSRVPSLELLESRDLLSASLVEIAPGFVPTGVSSHGEVVGSKNTLENGKVLERGFTWHLGGGLGELPLNSFFNDHPLALNDSRVAVGYYYGSGTGTNLDIPIRFDNGLNEGTALQTGLSYGNSWATAINSSGDTVGLSEGREVTFVGGVEHDGPLVDRATLWKAGTPTGTDLGLGDSSYATGINTAGMITGKSQGQDSQFHAFVVTAGSQPNWLPQPSDAVASDAVAINDLGDVIGHVVFSDSRGTVGAVWKRDVNTGQYTLGGLTQLDFDPVGLNNSDHIVGRTTAGSPIFWSPTTDDFNLGPFIANHFGWSNITLTAINDQDLLVGTGTNVNGQASSLVLSGAVYVLSVDYLSQAGELWASQDLGNVVQLLKYGKTVKTIQQAGCALTSLTMALNYAGISTDPLKLDQLLVNQNAYVKGDNIYFPTAAADALQINGPSSLRWVSLRTSDVETVRTVLLQDRAPVIVGVHNGNTSKWNHFVVVTGILGDSFSIADPGHEANTTLNDYGNTFQTRGYIADPPDLSRFTVSMVGTADGPGLQLINAAGQVTGVDSSTGLVTTQIPGSEFFVDSPEADLTGTLSGDTVSYADVFQPQAGAYKIEVAGTSAVPFTVAAASVSPAGIPRSPGTADGVLQPGTPTVFNESLDPTTGLSGDIADRDFSQTPFFTLAGTPTVAQGASLAYAVAATSPVGRPLTFSLLPGAPAGVSINPTSGILSWTPGPSALPGTYHVTAQVSDNGSPALSAAKDIPIIVYVPPLDPTFGVGGKVTTDFGTGTTAHTASVVLQPDGKLVVAGSSGGTDPAFLLARYNRDGSLDASFGSGGRVSTQLSTAATLVAVLTEPDSKLLVVGSGNGYLVLARYNPNGSLDATFGTGGLMLAASYGTVTSAALLANGGFMVAGRDAVQCHVARYTADGLLDLTFGSHDFGDIGDGRSNSHGGNPNGPVSVAVQPDGRLLDAYGTIGGIVVDRYSPDGSPDPSWGNGLGYLGEVETALAAGLSVSALTVQADGKVLVGGLFDAGSGAGFGLIRYNPDGSLDSTFGSTGIVVTGFGSATGITALVVQPGGKILAGGQDGSNFALARYNPDGSLDTSFAAAGTYTTSFGGNDTVAGLVLQSDGNVVAAGTARSTGANGTPTSQIAVARYLTGTAQVGSVQFSASTYRASEQAGSAVINVTRVGPLNGSVTLNYATSDGSARSGIDYTGTTGTLTFANGDASRTFSVPLTAEPLSVGDKTVSLTLSDLSGSAVLNGPSTAVLTIIGATHPPTLAHIPDQMITVGGNVSLTAQGTDLDGNSLTYSLDPGAPTEANINPATGVFTWTPTAAQAPGTYPITVRVTEPSTYHLSATQTFLVGVSVLQGTARLDTTLGTSGEVLPTMQGITDAVPKASVVRPDGKIVVLAYLTGRGDVLLCELPTGGLDPSFGTGGVVNLDPDHGGGGRSYLAVQPDGKIILLGYVLSRYTANGTLDTSFGTAGSSAPVDMFGISALVVQPDGKIVVGGLGKGTPGGGGSSSLIRYNADGTLDTSFQAKQSGFSSGFDAWTLALQPNGKIVAAGNSGGSHDFLVARFNLDGTPDTSFGAGGLVTVVGISQVPTAVIVQSDGKILVGGPSVNSDLLVRLNANGMPDTSFGTGGLVTTTHGQMVSLLQQPDGKVLVLNNTLGSRATPVGVTGTLERLNADGSVDTGFATQGTAALGMGPLGGLVLAGGQILMVGDSLVSVPQPLIAAPSLNSIGAVTLARYTAAGTPDATFGPGGLVATPATSPLVAQIFGLTVQPDGKLLAAGLAKDNDGSQEEQSGGNGKLFLARYNPDGTPDPTFGNGTPVFVSALASVNMQAAFPRPVVTPDGHILLAIGNDLGIARLNPDGSLDMTFGSQGVAQIAQGGFPVQVALLADGKVLVVGPNAPLGSASSGTYLVRYNPNGTLDQSFGSGGQVSTANPNIPGDAVVEANGQIIVVGNDYSTSLIFMDRFNPDGSPDGSLGGTGSVVLQAGVDAVSHAVALPDGRIIVAGDFGTTNLNEFGIRRYNADGTLDRSFGQNGTVLSVEYGQLGQVGRGIGDFAYGSMLLLQPDSKILWAGGFEPPGSVTRYNLDGSPDTTFAPNGRLNFDFEGDIFAVALQPDGQIVAAGDVALLNSAGTLPAVARLAFAGPSPGQFQFSAPTYSATDTDTSATITVKRIGGSAGAVSVDYSALAPYDELGTLRFDAGVTSQTFTVSLVPNPVATNPVAVNLSLSNPTNGATLGQSTAVLNITAGQTQAVISGTVFQDANINGTQDPGEPSLAGQTLFLDLDGSGVRKMADPTATTDSNGNYEFTVASPGTYTVRLDDGGALVDSPAGDSYTLTLTSGAKSTGKNFAEVPTSIAVPLTLPLTTPFPKQGNATADYVEALYRAILHRDADAGGLAAWTNLLDSRVLSRLQVVQRIRQSLEHFTQEVTDFYFTFLGRAPEQAGLQAWVQGLQNGLAEEQMAFGFLDSPEYLNKGDKYFVDHMYLSVLGRAFDSTGEANWLRALGDDASGNPAQRPTLTHEQVIAQFLRSPESLNRLVEGYYQVFLQRFAEPQGLNGWLAALQQGGSFLTIGQQFLSSDEFYNRAAANG